MYENNKYRIILLLNLLIILNTSIFGETAQIICDTYDGNITSSITPQGTSIDSLN
jgi:hypothetical protein